MNFMLFLSWICDADAEAAFTATQENANFLERKKHFKIENLASLKYIRWSKVSWGGISNVVSVDIKKDFPINDPFLLAKLDICIIHRLENSLAHHKSTLENWGLIEKSL